MFDHGRRNDFADVDCEWFETVEKGHGRVETRRCRVVSDPAYIDYFNDRGEWPKLRSVALVESERHVNGKTLGAIPFGHLRVTDREFRPPQRK